MSGSPAVERTVAGRPTRGRLASAAVRSETPSILLLGGVGLLAVFVYLLLALRIETPWIMLDELLYSEFAKGIAEDGELLVRGEQASHVSLLYPVLIAPAWLASSMETTYTLVKTINVILLTLASVPVYLWARRLMAPAFALITTLLVLLMPAFLYGGMVMTESAFLPAFLLASFTIARALERPTLFRQAAALGTIALAASIRVQGIALVGVLLTAIAVDWLLEWRGSGKFVAPLVARMRAFAPTLGLLFVVGAGYGIVKSVQGESLTSGLGAYQMVGDADYTLAETARWSLYHAAELSLSVAVIPVSAFLLLLTTAAWRGASSAAERAFLAVTASATVWLVITVSAFASRFVPRIEERNLFYLAPLFLLALGLWLSSDAPRPIVPALLAALLPVVSIMFLPVQRFLNDNSFSDTFGLIPLIRLASKVSGGPATVEWLMVVGACLAAALFIVVPGPLLRVVAPLAVAVFFVLTSYTVSGAIRDYSERLQGITYQGDGDWIDDAVGTEADAVYLYGSGADPGEESSRLWQTEFWNRSLGTVYRVGVAEVAGLHGVDVAVDGSTGSILTPDGEPIHSAYAVTAAPGFELTGDLVAQNLRLSLYRTSGNVGLATSLSGIYGDGWSGPQASYTRFSTPGDRPGRIRVVVSRAAWKGPDRPGRVSIRVGSSVDGALQRVTAERGWVVHSGTERTFALPTPPPPFRVEVTVDPTFSPADFGLGDPRELGAQVSFAFAPARR